MANYSMAVLQKFSDIKHFKDQVAEYENMFTPEGQIIDGVFRPEEYFTAPIRVAWMLKEAYTDELKTFHIKEVYNEEDPYNYFFKGPWRQTWHPIIYSSVSILNAFREWENIDWIRDDEDLCHIVRKIAVINANKFGSKTGTYTLYENLVEGFEASWPITQQQLNVLKPDVLIFGSTFFLYKDKFLLNPEQHFIGRFGAFDCWKINGQLLIDAKHPAQRTVSKRDYFESIVGAVKAHFSNKF
jgi:hypothetical protein